jgi:hypothetical protein
MGESFRQSEGLNNHGAGFCHPRSYDTISPSHNRYDKRYKVPDVSEVEVFLTSPLELCHLAFFNKLCGL